MIRLAMFFITWNPIDTVFFVVCAAIIAVAVGVYFLIPVINKKQYQEQRDNLNKREKAFKANLSNSTTTNDSATETSDALTTTEDDTAQSK